MEDIPSNIKLLFIKITKVTSSDLIFLRKYFNSSFLTSHARLDRNESAIAVSGNVIDDLLVNDQISIRFLSTNNDAHDHINLVLHGCC